MNDEAPLIELILSADLGMNYQCKTAARARGVCTALPATAARSPLAGGFQTMGCEEREGWHPRASPAGSPGAPAASLLLCLVSQRHPGWVREGLWMLKVS